MDLWPVASSFYICIYIFRIQEKVNNFHSYGSLEKQQHWLWFPHSNDMDTWHGWLCIQCISMGCKSRFRPNDAKTSITNSETWFLRRVDVGSLTVFCCELVCKEAVMIGWRFEIPQINTTAHDITRDTQRKRPSDSSTATCSGDILTRTRSWGNNNFALF